MNTKILISFATGLLTLGMISISNATPFIDQETTTSLSGNTASILPFEWAVQSFQTTAGNIVGAELLVVDNETFTWDLTINLMDGLEGNILATGTTITEGNGGYDWAHIDFSSGVALSENTTYFLSFVSNNPNVRAFVSPDTGNDYGYTGGQAFVGGTPFNSIDYDFRTIADDEFGNPTPAPVPEPATMLLFGAGIAGLIGSRFRKKK